MDHTQNKALGLERLVERCRAEFRRPENIDHYSKKDYQAAEKKFVRFCLTGDPLFTDSSGRFSE